MNKLKFIAGIALILTAFTFNSCENEPIDGMLNPDDFGVCAVPTGLTASDFNANAVTLSWLPGDDETSWTVEFGMHGFAHGEGTIVGSSNSTVIITGLNSNNSYDFYVRSNCSATPSSTWVGPVTVDAIQANPNCDNPGGLTAVRDSGLNTNVNLLWVAGNTETQWEIQFGVSGFALGSGTIVPSSNTTATVTGIAANSAYDFYVRAKCSATESSGWVGPKTVAAVGGGTPTGIPPGTYKMTAFNTSVPSDLNGDGTSHVNQMDEITCFNNMFMTLNANNTYVADQKGVEMEIDTGGGPNTYVCFTDPNDIGTWSISGNQVTITSSDITIDPTVLTVSGNTLFVTIPNGTVLDSSAGSVVEITCDITIIYTKQ